MKRVLLRTVIVIAVLLAVILAALPFVLPPIANRVISDVASKYGIVVKPSFEFGYCWRNGPGVKCRIRVSVLGTPWRPEVECAASACEWFANVNLPRAEFSESDPLLRKILEDYPIKAVSNLVFSGAVSAKATARRTFSMPVPVWEVSVPVQGVNMRAVQDGKAISVDGLSIRLGASGIARHLDISPMFLRIGSVGYDNLSLTNLNATIRATERSLMVSEASAGFGGGQVNVYSLFLDPKRLNAGFTVFIDDVDAGEVLGFVNGFNGEASGRLHGRVKMFVREGGKAIRLKDAFLYSTPGQVGRLRVYNSEEVAENLMLAGLDEDSRKSVAVALADMAYNVLRIDLERGNGNAARLSFHLRGSVTRGGVTAPVDLTINFNGDLEQLINTGLGYSNKLKGKIK